MEQDEVFVFSNDASIRLSCTHPYLAIRRCLHAELADVMGFVTFRYEPLHKCGRQISVDQKFHRSEAANTG